MGHRWGVSLIAPVVIGPSRPDSLALEEVKMSEKCYREEFNKDAVPRVDERIYLVAEVAERFRVTI